MKVCIKKCGFKQGYKDVPEDYEPTSRLGTGEYPLDEQDETLLAAWGKEIRFQNGDDTPVPVGFIPKSWDDPMIKTLFDAGFSVTINQWCPFKPALSEAPAHVGEFYHQIGLIMKDGILCYRRDFITQRSLWRDGKRVIPQRGFIIYDFFDRPPAVEIHPD